MPLLRGVGEISRSREIAQIDSEQHAKEDYIIMGDLSRGKKIKTASVKNISAYTGAKNEEKEENQNHRVQWHG